MGSRFGGTKQLEEVTDEGDAILDFSLYDAVEAGFRKIVFVVRSEILEEARSFFESKLREKADVRFVCQDREPMAEKHSTKRQKPFGTGHALLAARSEVNESFCMINADDYYGQNAFSIINNGFRSAEEGDFLMVGYPLKNTLSKFGTVSRGQCRLTGSGYLKSVIERKGILSENGVISCDEADEIAEPLTPDTIVSMNLWGFTPKIFDLLDSEFRVFLENSGEDPNAEFFINDVVNKAVRNGKAQVKVLRTDDEWVGVTYREDKQFTAEHFRKMKEMGFYPQRLW